MFTELANIIIVPLYSTFPHLYSTLRLFYKGPSPTWLCLMIDGLEWENMPSVRNDVMVSWGENIKTTEQDLD